MANFVSWKLTDKIDAIMAPVFGDQNQKVHGMGIRDINGSCEGFLDITDTAGQEAIKTAYEGRTPIDLKLYIDDETLATYYEASDGTIYITSLDIGAAQNEVVSIAFTFQVSGAFARVTASA